MCDLVGTINSLRFLRPSRDSRERAGGTLTVSREVFGPQAGNIIAVGQYPDWGAFAKMRSDPEFQSFIEGIRNNSDPPAEIVASGVFEEVTI